MFHICTNRKTGEAKLLKLETADLTEYDINLIGNGVYGWVIPAQGSKSLTNIPKDRDGSEAANNAARVEISKMKEALAKNRTYKTPEKLAQEQAEKDLEISRAEFEKQKAEFALQQAELEIQKAQVVAETEDTKKTKK